MQNVFKLRSIYLTSCPENTGVSIIQSFRFEERIQKLNEELSELAAYPRERFIEIVKEVGFKCNLCGKCCTRDFNDHAFLLEDDVERIGRIEEAAMVPAPYYEFCDQAGTFYVSGYAIRANPDGTCHFMENGRCRIYGQRPRICRIYPYMLHREEDDAGEVEWRQISGLNRHGYYHTEVDDTECRRMWDEVIDYEAGFLKQEIAFLMAVKDYFEANGLKHSPMSYDRQMRIFERGGKVRVNVFHNGQFVAHTVTKKDY